MCLNCKKSYRRDSWVSNLLCPHCKNDCEYVDWKIHIPSPKKKKEWETFWKRYLNERRLLVNFFRYRSKKPVKLEILNMYLKDLSNIYKMNNVMKKELNMPLSEEIKAYNSKRSPEEKKICNILAAEIDSGLPDAENKIWHSHPVWFLDGNPIVGYSKQKAGIRLMFWSGESFEEEKLKSGTGKFKDASIFYTLVEQIKVKDIKRWLKKSKSIQWDYKNIAKEKRSIG